MVVKSVQKWNLVILMLSQVSKVITNESCNLSNGKHGVCVPLISCERDKDVVTFKSDFCSNDFSEICCESVKLRASLDTTTESVRALTEEKENPQEFESYESYKHFDLNKCGELTDVDRISGGEEAGLFEFPWNALIGYDSIREIEFLCGGALINERYVLSASHCLVSTNGRVRRDVKIIRLGEHRLSTYEDCKEQTIGGKLCADPIQDILINQTNLIIHPDFNYLEKTHDIALIRLTVNAKIYQNNIKVICLPFKKKFETLPKSMIVIGYGKTEFSSKTSDVLLKVGVKLKTNNQCITEFTNYQEDFHMSDFQFCAGDTKDSCSGDSGSSIQFPQLFDDKVPRYIQYGIVSFGHDECGSHFPGIYTKVYPYLPWILENIN